MPGRAATLAALALVLACSPGCGDNTRAAPAAPDAPPPDAAGLPDLTLVASMMDGTTVVTDDTFLADSCELAEGCIGAAGGRRLLRFTTVTANVGTGPLVLGPVPPAGASDGIFVWSPCHMHHHVAGYATYEVLDATGVVASGHKQGFCIEDDERLEPGAGPAAFTCTLQGISPGWADEYAAGIPCQWVDVTDLASGDYTLRVTVNPTGALPDAHPDDNVWSTIVRI